MYCTQSGFECNTPHVWLNADARFTCHKTNVFDQDDWQATVTENSRECSGVMAMPERMDRPSQTGVGSCRKFCDS